MTEVDLGPGPYDDHEGDDQPGREEYSEFGTCDMLDQCPNAGEPQELHPETLLCEDCFMDYMEEEDFLRTHAAGRV